MKRFFTVLMLCLLTGLIRTNAQNPNHTWVSTMGGTSDEEVTGMAIDSQGNTFLVGTFQGTADFDPGTGVANLTSNGNSDIFIQKLDVNGALVWVKQIGGNSGDVAEGLVLDTNNSLHIVGYYRNTVDFDPGMGIANRSSGGLDDAFLLKLDSSGNFVWVQSIGRPGRNQFERLHAVTIDKQGNIITLGNFTGAFDMNPGTGTNFTTYSGGGIDIWLQKWSPVGNYIWGRYFGNSGTTSNNTVAVDASNNIYFAGGHSGSIDFQWGPGIGNIYSSVGLLDAYLVKYSSSGSYIYNYAWGGSGFDQINDIAIDFNNNVYVTGQFTDAPDFNPGVATNSIAANGLNDVFVSKFNSTGGYAWTRTFGSILGDVGNGIETDTAGNVYTTGYVGGTTDFDPGIGVMQPASGGGFDAFVHKMDPLGNFQWVAHLVSSTNESSLNIGIDSQNSITHVGTFIANTSNPLDFSLGKGSANRNSAGGNDIFVHKITECFIATSVDVQSACDSYTWIDGNIYTSSNNTATFTYSGVTASGCDSIVSLDLTINQKTTANVVQNSCGSFVWSQNGQTYTLSGMYNDTILNSVGCDSIITLNLTIDTVNTTISQNGFVLTANQAGASYQWIDCSNGNAPIAGATSQSYTVTANGDYAVEVSLNSCTDTSTCLNVMGVGIESIQTVTEVKLYPNPTNGHIVLELSDVTRVERINVRNISGQLVSSYMNISPVFEFDIDKEAGVYFIEILNNDRSMKTLKVVKQ